MTQAVELKAMRQLGDKSPPTFNTLDTHPGLPPLDSEHSNPPYEKDSCNNSQTSCVRPDKVVLDVAAKEYVSEPIDDHDDGCCFRHVKGVQTFMDDWWGRHRRVVGILFVSLCLMLYTAYFIYAMYHGQLHREGDIRLLWVTITVVVLAVSYQLSKSTRFSAAVGCIKKTLAPHGEKISWLIVTMLFLFLVAFILVDVFHTNKSPYNLVSAAGIAVFVLLFFIFSYKPSKVRWRVVVWGIGLQFVLALITLRTHWGYTIFKWLGDRVVEFLAHTDAGSKFVFGNSFLDHKFAFQILPIVIFFSSIIAILFYFGAMQYVTKGVAWVLQLVMGTTAAESVHAAGNMIFLGQLEAPLMIQPLVKHMTKSEIHTVMTGGFATIAGSFILAYIHSGIPANHLIIASVISAPAAVAMSKLFYPETEKTKTTRKDIKDMTKCDQRNVIEAASFGALQSTKLVANVAANLIAFIGILAFIDNVLEWLGHRVGVENVRYEVICSYILWPVAFLLGVRWQDCRRLGAMLGLKTFVNEFVAYDRLGTLMRNRQLFLSHTALNGSYSHIGDDIMLYDVMTKAPGDTYNVGNTTLVDGFVSARTEVISTYALCGFANFGSIGIMLGALGAMAPRRKKDLASIVFRALIAGNVACFMSACIAGLLYQGEY